MELTEKLLVELQRRLKIGNRRGVHLNAIPANSRYKFDLNRLSHIDKNLPRNFIHSLLTELPLKFRISWKDNVPDLNSLFVEDQTQLVRITKNFENLINQTEVIESEKGINTFGFGFPILIRRDQVDNKLTVAPILIWSLRIKRTKEFNTWEIYRNEDDPIYLNEVLINHLQSDSGIEIEQIPSEMLDDGLISFDELIEICANLIKDINTTVSSDIKDTFKKKIENISSIGDKAHYEKLPLNSTNAFIEFGGLFSIFEVQKQNIINEYGNLLELQGLSIELDDLEGQFFQPISSVETDPSQQSILHSLAVTRNVLIQGPPGTGKSQTLTAILINALENHKKTIVVCEKRTALEVLHNALIEKGLSFHCILIRDIIKDRKTVVDSVRDRVDKSEYRHYRYNYSKESLDNIIKKAEGIINSINCKHKKLDEKLLLNKSWTDIVGNLLTELKELVDDCNLDVDKVHFNYSSQELNSFLELVQKGQSLYNDFNLNKTASFINPIKLIGDNPYLLEQNINDDFDFYCKEIESINILFELVKKEYSNLRDQELNSQILKLNQLKAEFENDFSLFENLIQHHRNDFFKFRNAELSVQTKKLNTIITKIESIFLVNQNNPDLFNEGKIQGFGYKVKSLFSKSKRQTIIIYKELQRLFTQIESTVLLSGDFENIDFAGSINSKMQILPSLNVKINEVKSKFTEKITNEFENLHLHTLLDNEDTQIFFKELDIILSNNSISDELSSLLTKIRDQNLAFIIDFYQKFQNIADFLKNSKDLNHQYKIIGSLTALKSSLSDINSKIESIQKNFDVQILYEFDDIDILTVSSCDLSLSNLQSLQEKSKELMEKINSDNWTVDKINISSFGTFLSDVERIIEFKKAYFSNEHDLFFTEFRWYQYYNGLTEQNKKIINELKGKTDWRKVFLINYLDSLLVSSATVDLPTNENEHFELENTLFGLEKEQLKYIREYWYSQQIDTTRDFEKRNITLSVENLYNKRSSNRYKRLSLRQIVQYDANLFTTFFPIILTSPDVCCNLFKGMQGYFDIVMFDEASQLRLEDNLPAILKGKQIIIAGDEHQMPPSNYFNKIFEGYIEDEEDLDEDDEIIVDKDNSLLSCESLLDFGEELNFDKKFLDFHYRSRHPFLIDFSNYAFYNQRLKPLPHSFDYVPIKYIQVNGTFSEYINEAEAEMVLSIIDNNIHQLPNGEYPTVGVATFNIAQRNLIMAKIEERRKFDKYMQFNEKIHDLGLDDPRSNKSFIKNLENIQGDEKDVIILSTTYGIRKDGKFTHRFGPLNFSKGYKLLNVIITRAKYKVYVCSSIPEPIFLNYKEYLTDQGSNNKRAVLYAYLSYCKAVSEGNNDLRLSVLTALSENTSKKTNINALRGEFESPFEEEVYERLLDFFDEGKLIPQLQFAGFRIDIVYDPQIFGVPKIAIECDGAKHHSSREAYLYDRHRQKILEDHGFVFHRIWSTNWWRNPKRETDRLVHFIKDTVTTKSKISAKHIPHISSAFTDDIQNIEKYISKISFIDIEKDVETIQSIEKTATKQTELFSNEVKLNSKVKVKYVNNGKDVYVQIVDSSFYTHEKSNGIQKINIRSPLAISLIGHSIGDIVKVGNLDNFVEILEISD